MVVKYLTQGPENPFYFYDNLLCFNNLPMRTGKSLDQLWWSSAFVFFLLIINGSYCFP